jgi:hypothetical protein
MSQTDREQHYEVAVMLCVKKQLETALPHIHHREYLDILLKVNKYLHKYCNHDIVCDLIDIDPDRSKEISYCTICGNTL